MVSWWRSISGFMSWMSHPRALAHWAHADMCSHECSGLDSYRAGPACWRSGCLNSGLDTFPSRQTWSEVDRGHGAHPKISEEATQDFRDDAECISNRTCAQTDK